MTVEFAHGTRLHREADRRSDFVILRNGPPGTFVVFESGLRVSLPTDQILWADDGDGRARVCFGGMHFSGCEDGRLIFRRVRELQPEESLSPERSHVMTLEPEWVAAMLDGARRVWPTIVYKIAPQDLWRASEPSGRFTGSPVDERDGFIHFSTAAQVRETAARHFVGVNDLLLVAVATDGLELKWEPSRGGDLFPHLYGALPLDKVLWVRPLPIGADGQHVFPLLV